MAIDPHWKTKSRARQKDFKRVMAKVKPALLIRQLPALHEAAFSEINCLDCANCCKNHSPTFKAPDIRRISRYLGMKEPDFIETYLRLDEDNDFVLKRTPCTFLAEDNSCRIYDVRPSDCARYPYTDEDVFVKRKELTLANSMVCPAVFHVLEKISGID